MKKETLKIIAYKVRVHLARENMGKFAFAKQAGISTPTMTSVFAEKELSLSVYKKIADKMGVSFEELICECGK